MEALLSEKDQCHYIFAAVMMNLISRLQLRWVLCVCVCVYGRESCILYMFPSSCLHSCNKFPVCQPVFCTIVQTSSSFQYGEQKDI